MNMELKTIVQRMAESLKLVDQTTTTQRASRSGSGDYIPCVGTIWEDDFTREALRAWELNHPEEFSTTTDEWTEVKYPKSRGNCDFCFTSRNYKSGFDEPPLEWAIEVKYVRFIGDNGKNNDYGVTKVASPYRKDRSSVLDAERLQEFTIAKRKAIIMYGFEFDSESYTSALEWCKLREGQSDQTANLLRAKNMKNVLHKENPSTNEMSMLDLVPLFEAAVNLREVKLGPLFHQPFGGLTRHPLYRKGRILGWEINP
jgi:hypothetical protein